MKDFFDNFCDNKISEDLKLENLKKLFPNIDYSSFKNEYDYSVLHLSSFMGYNKILDFLLLNDVSPNTQDKLGNTPLHWAIINKKVVATILLLKYKANPNIQNNKGKTPLHIAIIKEYDKLVELLFSKGSDLTIRDKSKRGQTPLHIGFMKKYDKLLNLLSPHDPRINVQNNNGDTLLHIASMGSNTDRVKLLLKYAVDTNIQDIYGNTPLYVASVFQRRDTVKLLKKYNAKE